MDSIYADIAARTGGNIYIGVVGPVRTGKSTLIQMMMEPDEWLYKGKIIRKDIGRIGYVSQFFKTSKENTMTVFEYLSQYFVELQQKNEELCAEMATSENLDEVFERLIPNRHIEDRISRSIVSEELIADEASSELADIRRKIRGANSRNFHFLSSNSCCQSARNLV